MKDKRSDAVLVDSVPAPTMPWPIWQDHRSSLTDAQLARSARALAEARRQVAQEVPGARAFWLRVDREFHPRLTRASSTRILQRLLAGVQPQIAVFQVYGTSFRSVEQIALMHHQRILEALPRRDATTAKLDCSQIPVCRPGHNTNAGI